MRSGEKINAYEILAPIGAGGMGEVYRARDTRLNREVAIKVLPTSMASDADTQHRFQREAQMLASLSHPNIAAIHGLEIDGVTRAIVMELVEGPTLADRIAAGPIPIDEALPIARQIAEALEAAHDKGIIHRDLKPANIKVTPDGTVKVLDFGLAKALEEDRAPQGDPASSPTLVAGRSMPGLILGTAGYMSPEQARGGVVDKRTDIWAFGVVLFEMLTAKSLFTGETISDTLAAVLKTDPDWKALPRNIPPHILHILKRTLERDRKKRLRDIGIFLEAREDTAAPVTRRAWLPWALAATLAVLLIFSALRRPAAPNVPLRRYSFTPESPIINSRYRNAVLSPNGKFVAIVASGKLWVRPLDQEEANLLEFTEGGEGPFWSPDSNQLVFHASNELRKVSLQGGRPVTLCAVTGFRGGSWAASGKTILYSDVSKGVMEVDASGGMPRIVHARSSASSALYNPEWVSDRLILATAGDLTAQRMVLIDVAQQKIQLMREAAFATFSPTGHIIYQTATQDSGLWALPFSSSAGQAAAEPVSIAKQGVFPSLSREGTLLYTDALVDIPAHLVLRDRTGKEVYRAPEPAFQLDTPSFSPDGTRLVFSARTQGKTNIWIQDLTRNTRTRITFGDKFEARPIWHPSGKEIVFRSAIVQGKLFRLMLDGQKEPQAIADGSRPGSWSSDGRYFIFSVQDTSSGNRYIYFVERKSETEFTPRVPFGKAAPGDYPRLSPDSRFLAFSAEDTGRTEIYVRSFPDGDRKWQISSNGGGGPVWGPKGKELFFVDGQDRLMKVEINTRGAFSAGTPEFPWQSAGLSNRRGFYNYDISPDGTRFVVAEPLATKPVSMHLIQNWPELLKPAASQ